MPRARGRAAVLPGLRVRHVRVRRRPRALPVPRAGRLRGRVRARRRQGALAVQRQGVR